MKKITHIAYSVVLTMLFLWHWIGESLKTDQRDMVHAPKQLNKDQNFHSNPTKKQSHATIDVFMWSKIKQLFEPYLSFWDNFGVGEDSSMLNRILWPHYVFAITYTLLCKMLYHNICHIFINIFQTVGLHFSAVKFTRGNEKNTSFILIPKSPKVWKKLSNRTRLL